MSNHFEVAWAATHAVEKGFVDDPSDSGGATNHGVTEAVARAHGYQGPMRELPLETATTIAKVEYWDPMRLDDVAVLSERVAREMFDTSFNTGHRRAVRFLQRSLNALNRRQRDYDDQLVDGVVGRRTIAALAAYLEARPTNGEEVMVRALDCLQGAFYVALTERREKDERFLYGWLRTRIKNA